MKDTAGNEIITDNPFCRCGLTGGCYLCNPTCPPLHNDRLQKVGEALKEAEMLVCPTCGTVLGDKEGY